MVNNGVETTQPVWFRVLGPLAVTVGGETLNLGGPKPRAVLALLLADANHVVSTTRIVEALWGPDAPDRAPATLQVHVSNLRKALAPAAAALGVDDIVQTQKPGYRVEIDPERFDLAQFRSLVAHGQAFARRGDLAAASTKFSDALTFVHGEPLADVVDEPFAGPVATNLRQLIANARAARFETELALGRHRETLGEIEAAVVAEPLDEHLRALCMLALYRCGRQADALAAFQAARNVLVEELGVDPSPELRELEARILEHDPGLAVAVGVPVGTVASNRPAADFATVLRSSVLIPAAVLVVETDGDRRIRIAQPVTTIGRGEGCDVVIDDPQVSRLHVELRVDGGRFVLVDQRSTNGTVVNGERIAELPLLGGEVITLGRHRLRFELGPS